MSADEREHAEILAGLSVGPTSVPADARAVLNKAEPWHRTDKSGALRAAIFGVSDGLVSNTALVMGFAGSGVGGGTVLFAGLAGLLAGAFSMAAGEYVSVASQTDLFRRELAIEARELQEKPEEEQRELELLYRAKGLDAQTARTTAAKIMADPETALDTLAREELGLDPDDLGDPKRVAASSFAAFAVGAAVPVIPYVFLTGTAALTLAVTLAVLALIVVGGTVGRLSGLGVVRSALRQVLVGGGAAAITYVLGRLVGTGLG
jgi:VIT1/CCC1 family predicted Fe2+/Mn2+ transporter